MQEVDVYYIKGIFPIYFIKNLNYPRREQLIKKISEYRTKYPKSNTSNVKGWHSDYNTHDIVDTFDDINNFLLNKCEKILKFYDETVKKIEIADMWVNMYEKGDHTVVHNHSPGADYVCCYYVDVEGDYSPILFPPDNMLTPENDTLIFFDSKIYHGVPPTNGNRIVTSINFTVEKQPSISLLYS